MSESREAREGHPAGDGPSAVREVAREAVKVDTFGGTVHVEWDPDAAATPLGHLAFFAEYLKVSGRFDALVADCPLHYTSPNAPSKRDVLGTVLLSALAGQWRYAHITALRGDRVNPSLLGMSKVASEDSVRRGLERIEAEDGTSWLHGHLDDTVRPLLSEPWVLDCDTTIKPLYGHQEGAVVSYNPKKPGRPSHAYHAFLMAGTRLVLDVDVAPGNRHRSKSAAPSLWALLERLGREHRPRLVRGDKHWGSEGNMASCEGAGLVRRAVEAFGGEWGDIETYWTRVDAAVRDGVAAKSIPEIKELICDLLQETEEEELPRNDVVELMKQNRPWKIVKRFGADGIPSGQAQTDYGVIRTKLEEIGIYLIPVGEIENFCRELGSHGPKFVARLLSKNDLSDANLDGLRSFVERVHTGPYGK